MCDGPSRIFSQDSSNFDSIRKSDSLVKILMWNEYQSQDKIKEKKGKIPVKLDQTLSTCIHQFE